MDGFRDSAIERLWLGIIVPSLVLVLIVFNILSGRVYWLAGRSGVSPERRVFIFQVFWDGWRVTGTILIKLGLAAGLVSWFLLANNSKTERLALPCLIGSIVIAALGLLIHVVGFF